MGIKQLTPMQHIEGHLHEKLQALEFKIIRNLDYVGLLCIRQARSLNSYKDRTGNLRSSIGYVIVKDGVPVSQFVFDGTQSDGVKSGKEFLQNVISEFSHGIALIVVAGMNYAGYVSAKGYDVLDSAELLAQKTVPTLLKKLEIQ
jgi:hypothetical protein